MATSSVQHAGGLAYESARPQGSKMVAIRFEEKDAALGMAILLRQGPARAYPDFVYILRRQQAEQAFIALHEAGVAFAWQDQLPARLTRDVVGSLKGAAWRQD